MVYLYYGYFGYNCQARASNFTISMQKDFLYNGQAVRRRTSMLVNFEIDEKLNCNPAELSSTYMKEELPPWTFLLIAEQQKPRCYDSMQFYSSNAETIEDWEFLHAADKENAYHDLDETLNQFKRQGIDHNNNSNSVNYCLKENGLIYMDGKYTRGERRRPADDVEAIYNEETGETSVKLWQCLYPIDLNEMSFVEEGEQSEGETKCTPGYKMLAEGDNQYFNTKTDPENNWALSSSIEPLTKYQTLASTKCKTEMDKLATNYTKSDEPFDETIRSRCGPCVRNGSCASVKMSDYSYPVSNDESRVSSIRIENTPYVSCRNTPDEDHSMQYVPESTNSFVYKYQFETSHTPETKSVYREDDDAFNYESCDSINQITTASSFPCHYNPIMAQTNFVNNSNEMFTNVPEQMSSSDRKKSHFPMPSNLTIDGPTNQGHSDALPVKGISNFMCKNDNKTLEGTDFKSKKMKRGCRLWEYIRNLLLDPCTNPSLIKWEDRDEGTFKLVENKKIAFDWGWKKGNRDMSYEKLSRAMRYYYKKKIFQPVIGKRLVYKFGPNATGWREDKKLR